MTKRTVPHFTIKRRAQKGGYLYSDILTPEILKDVCLRVTGCDEYTCEFIDGGYNKGRLAILEYQGTITYVSFSEAGKIEGRNSFFQSLTTALSNYYREEREQKRICFYFLPLEGNVEGPYFRFMYRVMATAGVEFLNSDDFLKQKIYPFITTDDLIAARHSNRSSNRGNNSTYITKGPSGVPQIYGKTYGASKKEAALLCIVLSHLTPSRVELYEICEQDLSELPKPDLEVIRKLRNVEIIPTSLSMERVSFERDDKLRSARFIYNLLAKLGPKKCALCGCEIPELINGAHIWPVADIKRQPALDTTLKLEYALDGDNGLWLCENHHKLFDEGFLLIDRSGKIECRPDLEEKTKEYITAITPVTHLDPGILTPRFDDYLQKRYEIK